MESTNKTCCNCVTLKNGHKYNIPENCKVIVENGTILFELSTKQPTGLDIE